MAGTRFIPGRSALILAGAVMAAMMPGQAMARDALGAFGAWAAFRDTSPPRCYAISEPDRTILPPNPQWRPFFAIGDWPRLKARGQVHLRLAKPRKPGTPLRLTVGTARFGLVSAGVEAWAPDTATDAAIATALRTSRRATVTGIARDGTAIRDGYAVTGAATAIDAARLGCARL